MLNLKLFTEISYKVAKHFVNCGKKAVKFFGGIKRENIGMSNEK